MKNRKKLKDGDGCAWTTNSAGLVISHDEGEYTPAEPPALSEDK